MYWWRITKYNPAYRNALGYYLKDEWICFSDIGKKFEGHILTGQEYLATESAYILAVKKFMECMSIKKLTICSLEKHVSLAKAKAEDPYAAPEMLNLYSKTNRSKIDENEIGDYIRLILRHYLWALLRKKSVMEVHFGWDYYMYIGSAKSCPTARQAIEQSGLFVEPWDVSPYYKK